MEEFGWVRGEEQGWREGGWGYVLTCRPRSTPTREVPIRTPKEYFDLLWSEPRATLNPLPPVLRLPHPLVLFFCPSFLHSSMSWLFPLPSRTVARPRVTYGHSTSVSDVFVYRPLGPRLSYPVSPTVFVSGSSSFLYLDPHRPVSDLVVSPVTPLVPRYLTHTAPVHDSIREGDLLFPALSFPCFLCLFVSSFRSSFSSLSTPFQVRST